MYLKSIEIHGFKSFANKIVFDFHNGITGIVGPNGSGKSNVADAVRWVLGEQKVKQLRSSSMQDVIFAGTENRKPLSYAYVSITLDNSDHALALDYNEVTVARRVYRSGESEYLLNGTTCRLKDIQELFYDTGIGKEGYSIIGQGQIDKILSGKPEERRELFDEAAGIVKYKRRKIVTLKKLENEQANLVRINDIISELERQLGPLERQSEHAKTYLKKKEELKSYDVNLFLNEMNRMEQDEIKVNEAYTIADQNQKEAKDAYEQIRVRYDELEEEMSALDQEISELQTSVNDSGVEKEKMEGRIGVLREQIRSIQQSEAHVQERMDELSGQIDERQQTGEQYSREMADCDLELQDAQSMKESVDRQIAHMQSEVDAMEQRIEEGKQNILRLVEERGLIRGEQQRLKALAEQNNIRKSQLDNQLLTQKSTESDVGAALEEKEAELEALGEKILRMEKKKIEIDQKRRKWRAQAQEINEKLEEVHKNFHRQTSRLESLKNIAERYDGYGNSIRRVMERKSNMPGIQGVVADLIKVDKKYETAIETALGGRIQNIVTDNENTAKELISYLKQNRFGRATFLPLTSVSAPSNVPAAKALHETGAIGLADSLVKTDEKYRGVAGYLLGRTLVVDTIDHAIAIEKKYHYSIQIVTLEGESLAPGGSMTGGAFKNNSNLLGRNREIEALEKEIANAQAEEEKLNSRMEDVETADELLKDDFDEIVETLQESYLQQNTLNVEVAHMRDEKAAQEEFYQGIQKELEEIEANKEQISLGRKQAQERMDASRKKEEELDLENKRLAVLLDEKKAEIISMQDQANEMNVAVSKAQQRIDFVRENVQRVAEEILRLHQTQQEVLLNAANSRENVEEREQEIEQLQESIRQMTIDHGVLGEKIAANLAKKEELSKEHKGFFDKREELAEELSRLDKELFRLNDRKEKIEASRENMNNYMWEEYELTRHMAKELHNPELPDTAELKKMIAGVKDEIRKLGNVNVNAIEEYKEVSERYEFLHGQQMDLQEAEQTLQDIISDLDDAMRKQFSEKFDAIQKEFDRVFKELFGGGKGTLELAITEEKDILECGVNIIAQPPGKKLQNMMQLSGGEKALTAISLLFAIQNLKPSPFCLLDEIEAALDDSNVDRYARYLHKLTKNTQFIVITHRRGTMTAADRLYGITMQEKGVSTLVSVDLIEKDLDE